MYIYIYIYINKFRTKKFFETFFTTRIFCRGKRAFYLTKYQLNRPSRSKVIKVLSLSPKSYFFGVPVFLSVTIYEHLKVILLVYVYIGYIVSSSSNTINTIPTW